MLVRNDAAASWQRILSRIDIAGGTANEQREFYTAFYHAMLHPNVFSDADGRYRGYDQRVHRVPARGERVDRSRGSVRPRR